MKQEDDPRTAYTAIGVVPGRPVFFFDFDRAEFRDIVIWATMEKMVDYDIYKTAGGHHLVADVTQYLSGWDQVQRWLVETAKMFPEERYILNCRKIRLRISPKFDKNGFNVSPEPVLAYCHCKNDQHHDKREENCKKVGYYTATD